MIARNYLWRNLIKAAFLVAAFLILINFIADFTYEIGWLGKGDYHTRTMLIYLILMLPVYLGDLAPISLLLGFLLALILMVKRSEIVVLFTTGVSKIKLAQWVAKLALVLIIILTIFNETAASFASALAARIRARAISSNLIHITSQGTWLRSDDLVIHIDKIDQDRIYKVSGFQLSDSKDNLISAFYASRGYFKDGRWQLVNARTTHFKAKKIKVSSENKTLAIEAPPKMLQTSGAHGQNLYQLAKTISYLRACGIDTRKQEMAWWQRLFRPLNAFLLTMLALPIALTSLGRRGERNIKLLLGILMALSFYALEAMLGLLGILNHVKVQLVASIPSVIMLLSLVGWFSYKKLEF